MIPDLLDALESYFSSGGYVMWPLVGATVVLWYALGYRFVMLRRGSRRSVYQLVDEYQAGRGPAPRGLVDEAAQLGAYLSRRTSGALRPVLDDAFAAFEHDLKRGKSAIGSVVAIAPLLGLLGTVTGMIETFDSMAEMAFFTQSGGIAGGIAEALFTTQMGLVVAVPGVILGRILDRWQTFIEDEISRIKDILCAGTPERAS